MANDVEVCVIDDDPSQRKLVSRLLEKQGYAVDQACDGQEGLNLIRRVRPKVILSDWMMPHLDGMGLCEAVRTDPSVSDTYFVLLTSRDTVDDKASALETGADDFLTKPCDPREMIARVRVGIRMWKLRQELRQAAITDGLTGLYNHHHFSRLLDAEYERARRYGQPLSLIIADLDHFKSVNDTCGHEAGNMVLRWASQSLKNSVRSVDIVARYGGEEFAIVLPETALQNAMDLAERLRDKLPGSMPPGVLGDRTITASFGVASVEDPRVASTQQLIDLADQALYVAKRTGRNRVVTCSQVSCESPTPPAPEQEADVLRRQIAKLTTQNEDLKRQILYVLVQALAAKDPAAACHARNVKLYADAIARRLKLMPEVSAVLGRAALLHETGAIDSGPDESSSGLASEFSTSYSSGQRILDHVPSLAEEMHLVRHLFEAVDGSGKPEGLRAEDIPLGSRILRVADAFDELIAPSLSRVGVSLDEAVSILQRDVGRIYDPIALRALADCVKSEREAWQLRIEQNASERQFSS